MGGTIDKRFRYFKRNKTNKRLDTNFTNIKKEIRQFILRDYVCIDLKNSQPFFLSQLIKTIIQYDNNNIPLCSHLCCCDLVKTFGIKAFKHISKVRQNQEKPKMSNFRKFEQSVIEGKFYNDFILQYPGNLTREKVKDIIIKVMFSRNTSKINFCFIPYEEDKKKFASVYPFIYDVIKILKEKNHAELAICLQRMESYIFIDCIAKKLVNNGIVPITIHDSVIIPEGSQDKALEIMRAVFKQKFNVVPSFHVEPLK